MPEQFEPPKGEHSKGTLIHDYCSRIAVVGNLYASNLERNPLLKPNARAYIANNGYTIPSGAPFMLRGPKMNTENIPTACVRPRSPQWATC